MLKKYVLSFFIGLSLSLIASTVYADPPPPPPQESVLNAPASAGSYPISSYQWDAEGFFSSLSPQLGTANVMVSIAVFLIRISMELVRLGFQPTGWLNPVDQVANILHNATFIDYMWAFLPLVTGFAFAKDMYTNNYHNLLKRGSTLLLALLIYYSMTSIGTSDFLRKVNDAIGGVTYSFSGWILSAGDKPNPDLKGEDKFNQSNTEINGKIWNLLVDNPWEAGEFGTVGLKLEDKAAEVKDIVDKYYKPPSSSIKSEITQPPKLDITKDTTWREVLLLFPNTSTDARKQLVRDVLLDKYKDDWGIFLGFSDGNRQTTAILMLLTSICVAIYFTVVGLLLLAAHALLMAGIISGVFLIPLAMLPTNKSALLLRAWWGLLYGSVAAKFGLATYIAFTFFVVKMFSP